MSAYNYDDILIFAVNIEKNGEKFYRNAASQLKDKNISDFFVFLADEEINHLNYFNNLLKKTSSFTADDGEFNEEYFLYLKAFVENAVFKSKRDAKSYNEITTVEKAFDLALSMEQESIAFYTELKKLMSHDEGVKVEEIIEEEKRHFLRIYEMKLKSIK